MKKLSPLLLCVFFLSTLHGEEKSAPEIFSIGTVAQAKKNNKRKWSMRLTKKDHLPEDALAEESSCYLEGYIQALIDANYYENYVIVSVDEDHVVYLFNLPSDERIKNSIISFVEDLPGIKKVVVKKIDKNKAKKITADRHNFHLFGVWFPETTVLFEPLIANPRDPVYSIAYRWGDQVIANNQIAISLGDIFPIYRFFDVFGGDLQIDIGACMWADFNMSPAVQTNNEWAELVTTDYILSIPISYSIGIHSFRLRAYHISSHLGDEFMVNNPDVLRVNPSFEAIDFFWSIQYKDAMRIYFGPGVIVNDDISYPMGNFYVEYGLEFRPFTHKYKHPRLYGNPFFALDCQNWDINNYNPSLTVQIGYEWSKLERAGRNVRIFFEYHNGFSEGQFFTLNTDYWAIRGAWGF
ncbi:DUF1207 domain-containing protein [bacterium]|nr:DUF1207 domain-containing protein [bacterium]